MPVRRSHPVYLPPGYADSDRHYPVLWCLAAYTSAGLAQVGWRKQGENLPARLDRLIASGKLDPVIVVFSRLLHLPGRQPSTSIPRRWEAMPTI